MNTDIQYGIVGLIISVLLAGCHQDTIYTPREIQFKEVGLRQFRESPLGNIKAVLLLAGDIDSKRSQFEGEILLMVVEKNEFTKHVSLDNFGTALFRGPIEDRGLLEKLITFEAWDDAYWGFSLFIVYLVEDGDTLIGYTVPIGERENMIQGHYWHSKELTTILSETLQEQGIDLETGEWLMEYKAVDNLSEFRKSVPVDDIEGILIVLGDIMSEDHVVLFAVSEKDLHFVPMKHFDKEIVKDDVLQGKLIRFKTEESPILPVYKLSLVYVAREGNKHTGYVLPFDMQQNIVQGKQWRSGELRNLIREIFQKYDINLEE